MKSMLSFNCKIFLCYDQIYVKGCKSFTVYIHNGCTKGQNPFLMHLLMFHHMTVTAGSHHNFKLVASSTSNYFPNLIISLRTRQNQSFRDTARILEGGAF